MKYLFLIFCILNFAFCIFAQSDLIQLKHINAEEANSWKLITMTDELKDGWSWHFKTAHRSKSGDVEVWIKSIPFDTAGFRKDFKQKTARYVMEFYTFHCRDRRFSAESVMIYGDGDKLLIDGGRAGRRYREPLVPDSVNAGLYDFFCN